jgi:hypothetical protein
MNIYKTAILAYMKHYNIHYCGSILDTVLKCKSDYVDDCILVISRTNHFLDISTSGQFFDNYYNNVEVSKILVWYKRRELLKKLIK